MNTDNMAIDGRTIDYGPYAMLDDYEENYICNHTDVEGRYSFKNQPSIMLWNLLALAHALSPLVNMMRMDKLVNETFKKLYEDEYLKLMKEKLGLYKEDEDDVALIRWLFGSLEQSVVDYSRFFRILSHYEGDTTELLALCEYQEPLTDWLEAYDKRLEKEEEGDFSMIEDLLTVALDPFSEHEELEHLNTPTPPRSKNLKLSCSS